MPAELMKALAALAQEPSDSSDSDSLPEPVTRSLAASTVALTQNEAETQEVIQQDPAGYGFQSGGVLDMLGKLTDQFTTEKTNLEEEEQNAQNVYEKLAQQLSDNLDGANTELDQKKALFTKTR